MERNINKSVMLLILATGVFGILNTEMGFIGILPYIAEYYQVSVVQAGWLISLFALGVAVAGPTMPLFMSRFNRKWLMVFIWGLFTVCSTIAVFAENFYVLLAVRVLPAFFHPVYCAMAFTVAAGLARTGEEPKMVAKINMGVAAGMVAGVPISNFLAEQFSLSASMAFFAAAFIDLALLSGGSAWPFMGIVVVFWGILAGINGNINQYWISHAAPEAPDFANGLFLTAANLGCVLGTTISGKFIETLGMDFVVLGGLLCCALSAVVIFIQCSGMKRQSVEYA